jgi:putative FmdB family regulatory protein
MPTYEYECTKCGAVTDVFQSITDTPKRRLSAADNPACDCNAPVKRRIGCGAGIIFKGSGFYQTDYRSESYKQGAKAEKEAMKSKSDKGAEKSKKKDSAKKTTESVASKG